ncbi:MAG: glycosyl hydrolase 115 family protein [Bacteroidota bacterium]|nr:glycosyl hydrolase 115 family protein [Bacteroidota bacterium]
MKTMGKIALFCISGWFSSLQAQTLLVYGDKADTIEINATKDLLKDWKQSVKERVTMVPYHAGLSTSAYAHIIYIGTAKSNSFIQDYTQTHPNGKFSKPLEPETFVLQTTSPKTLLIVGADTRGTFYGIYDFSQKILGVDPNTYWIGYQQKTKDKLVIPELSFRKPAPVYKYRGYFDNDNDLLANFKGRKLIVELDLWKEIINTVARLGYNYIDIHDLLGRPEYYLRDYYIKLTTYHTDLKLVDEVIDYAHSKGLLVQIPMYLGWEFKHITLDQTCLTKYYDLWMETYQYYLTQTPLGKADLFLQRPRHPFYDWAYKCPEETAAGIRTGDLMNKMFEGLYQLLQKYRPGSVLFCDLWSEGRPLWASGEFSPRKDVEMLWADNGHADFKEFPKDLKGYSFGIYIHAGVWYNNVTQSPYPDKIKEAALMGIERKMTHNFLVNGQTFKNFLLNLTACGLCAWDPVSFDPELFYREWTSRYFGANVSGDVVKILKWTYAANEPIGGFRNTMNTTVQLLNRMQKKIVTRESMDKIDSTLQPAAQAWQLSEKLLPVIGPDKRTSYIDQIYFPAKIFYLDQELLKSVLLLNNTLATDKNNTSLVQQQAAIMRESLVKLREALTAGSGWDKWKNFYLPENFRIHTPPPDLAWVDQIINGL